jgi:hypothetical protein
MPSWLRIGMAFFGVDAHFGHNLPILLLCMFNVMAGSTLVPCYGSWSIFFGTQYGHFILVGFSESQPKWCEVDASAC